MPTSETWIALLALTGMEVVLGIDNIVFLSILVGKLPLAEQARARLIGLSLALLMRLGLLAAISWVMGLTAPLFVLFDHAFSGRHLILLGGGLFLVAKATHEIYDKMERAHPDDRTSSRHAAFWLIIVQLILLDLVFSLDSVITAVGMARQLWVMVVAMVVAVLLMLAFSGAISRFVERHPSLKMLGLSFLLLIGVMLVAEGMGQHVGKGYIYFAMAFSLGVEMLNIRVRQIHRPLVLHHPYEADVTRPKH
ncbi:MAG: TerC family protein [Deltaproteobacteria bacterium]|nr:TerC family protein [Deltaproteobacteria bacterium]